VTELLGRQPRSAFIVVVRDPAGDPVVIRNPPLLDDGTPMPTRYWLVGKEARLAVDRLESSGGVRAAALAVGPAELAAAHALYAAERDSDLPAGWGGPRPSGGVGGTRRGVKCLHAHYAWHLAGGDDPVGRWVAGQLAAASAGAVGAEPPVAAIDCGTQSTRLLIAYPGGATVERLNRITRLGQGVDRTGRLAPEAVGRTVAVLREYKAAMYRHGVQRVRMTATSAARDAVNREDFFSAAESVVGIRPELIVGAEEGKLSFAGATADLDPSSGPWLVVDIGGGSTELVVGPGPDGGLLAVTSLEMGCVRISERYLVSDPPTSNDVEAARHFARALMERAADTRDKALIRRSIDNCFETYGTTTGEQQWGQVCLSMMVEMGQLDDAFRFAERGYADTRTLYPPEDDRWLTAPPRCLDTARLFSPQMAPFRDDPRFWSVALRTGLVNYWQITQQWPDFCRGQLDSCKARAAAVSRVDAGRRA